MNRRELVATVGGAVAVVAGCLDGRTVGDASSDEGDPEEDDEPPFEVSTVDAPGSEAGTVTVPSGDDGRVQFVNFTRTGCPTSAGLIGTIGAARRQLADDHDVGSGGDIRFLSVIDATWGDDPTDAELTEWWAEHDGEWTLGVDEPGTLTDYYEVAGFPTIVVIDGDGDVHWRETDNVPEQSIVSNVGRALEAAADGR